MFEIESWKSFRQQTNAEVLSFQKLLYVGSMIERMVVRLGNIFRFVLYPRPTSSAVTIVVGSFFSLICKFDENEIQPIPV